MKKVEKTFWLTNISDRNVMLSDLNLQIKARSSVNLLSKHYSLTEEELEKSLQSGSIFFKRDKIVKRLVPPETIQGNKIELDSMATIPSKQRSILEVKNIEYEELKMSDDTTASAEKIKEEEFNAIAQNIDTIEADGNPLISKIKGLNG